MTDWQTSPGGLYVPQGAADGAYLAHKDGVRFTEFLRLADGSSTTVNIDSATGEVSIDASLVQLVPLTTVVGGVPELVWDADNQLVLTEAP
jgi:hypothetical protein